MHCQGVENGDDDVDRHVGFSPEVEFIEKAGKLRRRDTPHHLKNKRITSQMNPEEKLKHILAQVTKSTSSDRSSTTNDKVTPPPFDLFLID